jgi:hypothetical protein
VVASCDDVTADRVVAELGRRRVPVLRLDVADFPHEARLDAAFNGHTWAGSLTAHGYTVSLQDLGAVLWWSPTLPQATAGLPAAAAWRTGRETTAGLTGVLGAVDCLHVNHPAHTHTVQAKPRMLARAAGYGLAVPDTWIGNAPAGAIDFAAAGPHGAVCRPLAGSGSAHFDSRYPMFALRPVEMADLDNPASLTSQQLQHALSTGHRVRLTAVGDRIFAARADARPRPAQRLFGADRNGPIYRPTTVPEPVAEGVRGLMTCYGLRYAALDFLLDADGRWWLQDLDPAGPYAWLEDRLPALGITAALADLLTTTDVFAGRAA